MSEISFIVVYIMRKCSRYTTISCQMSTKWRRLVTNVVDFWDEHVQFIIQNTTL
jgi:hypothetical protein